jgi:hypothetical protein
VRAAADAERRRRAPAPFRGHLVVPTLLPTVLLPMPCLSSGQVAQLPPPYHPLPPPLPLSAAACTHSPTLLGAAVEDRAHSPFPLSSFDQLAESAFFLQSLASSAASAYSRPEPLSLSPAPLSPQSEPRFMPPEPLDPSSPEPLAQALESQSSVCRLAMPLPPYREYPEMPRPDRRPGLPHPQHDSSGLLGRGQAVVFRVPTLMDPRPRTSPTPVHHSLHQLSAIQSDESLRISAYAAEMLFDQLSPDDLGRSISSLEALASVLD